MYIISCSSSSHHVLDPLNLVYREPPQSNSQWHSRDDLLLTGDNNSEKLMREQSIRSNRRQKFVACITNEDVSMGASRFLHSNANGVFMR